MTDSWKQTEEQEHSQTAASGQKSAWHNARLWQARLWEILLIPLTCHLYFPRLMFKRSSLKYLWSFCQLTKCLYWMYLKEHAPWETYPATIPISESQKVISFWSANEVWKLGLRDSLCVTLRTHTWALTVIFLLPRFKVGEKGVSHRYHAHQIVPQKHHH